MKVIMTCGVVVLLAGCGFFHSITTTPSTPQEAVKRQIHQGPPAVLKAGTARVEITPPVGVPLAGYSKRRGKPSTGIRDPLYVRAAALSDGEDTVLILSADLLVFPQPVAEELLARLSRELGVPRSAIVLAATHTHNGSGGIGHGLLFERVFGAYNRRTLEGIEERILWAARQAIKNSGPVRWGMASDPAALQGLLENRAVPDGPADPALGALVLESEKGDIRAVLVNAAAHPTLMDSQDLRFSADFPGEICRRVEESYPGSVCLFLNGAAGDARPRDVIGESPDQRIERFGRAAAESVTGLVSRARIQERGDLAAWGTVFSLPAPQLRLGWIPIHPRIGRMMRPTHAFINLITLNDVLLVPLSAEMTAEVGAELKRKLADRSLTPLLVGYANGYLGYVVTAQRYGSGSYEAWMTWYGPGMAQTLIRRIEELAVLGTEKSSE